MLPCGVMDDLQPEVNPFTRVRLRGVWAWVLLSGLVVLPLAAIGARLGWLVPRRDLFVVLYFWLYAAPLAWLVYTARRHGIRIGRWLVPSPTPRGWLEAAMIVPPQLLFSASSFMLLATLIALAFPEAAQGLLDRPEMSRIAPPGTPQPLVALMVVLVAPVAEEILFRGLLLHTLASRWGFRRAAFVTAGIFALLHANLIGIFVFGLVLTVLYTRTRSLLAPMLCHALNNLIPFLMMSMHTTGTARGEDVLSVAGLKSHAVLVAVVAGLSGLFMFTFLKQRWPERGSALPYDDAGAPLSDRGGVADDSESTSSRDHSPSPPPA